MGGSQLRCVILDEYWNEVLALIANCHPMSTTEEVEAKRLADVFLQIMAKNTTRIDKIRDFIAVTESVNISEHMREGLVKHLSTQLVHHRLWHHVLTKERDGIQFHERKVVMEPAEAEPLCKALTEAQLKTNQKIHKIVEKKLDQAKSLRRQLAEDFVKVSIEISSEMREILSQKKSQIPKAEIASIAASITKQKLDDIREEIENQIEIMRADLPVPRVSKSSAAKPRKTAPRKSSKK
ncbi:unnamed protein product [Oikopleura dioica]|uniref:Uncharacterized protein n=1 Tax=Oikopleura dioica TaxID=34765 RepID=E4XT20_OIKDI|nr:unnamed protein product [Oikopleura dioica]